MFPYFKKNIYMQLGYPKSDLQETDTRNDQSRFHYLCLLVLGIKFKGGAIKCCKEKKSSPPNEWCNIPFSYLILFLVKAAATFLHAKKAFYTN